MGDAHAADTFGAGAGPPALAVVLATPSTFQTVQKTVHCLRAQREHERLELLIVVRSRAAFDADAAALAGFGRVELIEAADFSRIAPLKAMAVTRATAAVVAFAEDHCFPDDGWAAALLDAHQEGWAGVGPAVRNANPATALSRSAYLMHWCAWMEPVPHGEADAIPWHNSSYKRDVLLALRDDLPHLFASEMFLQDALHARGHRFCVAPGARVAHTNISRFGPWLTANYWGGRLYGARRARYGRWSRARRGAYALAAPLVPLVRLWRLLRRRRPAHESRDGLLATLPLLLLGLGVHALGEAAGYVLGEGRAEVRYSDIEMYRHRDLARGDLPLVMA